MSTKRKIVKRATAPRRGGSVDDFLADLDHPQKAAIVTLRKLILGLDPRIKEEIKWNAPSFFITDHFATFKLRPPETVQVALHTGTKVRAAPTALKIEDPGRLLTWAAKDRCIATFQSSQDVEAKREAFSQIVRGWISQL